MTREASAELVAELVGIVQARPAGCALAAIYAVSDLAVDQAEAAAALREAHESGLVQRRQGMYFPLGVTPARRVEEEPVQSKRNTPSQDDILRLLPATAGELVEQTGRTHAGIYSAVYEMKKAGIVAKDGQQYVRAGSGGAKQQAGKNGKGGASVVGARKPAAPAVDAVPDRVVALLQRGVTQAQDALDEYITSVCDPETLALLRALRDGARQTLAQYEARARR